MLFQDKDLGTAQCTQTFLNYFTPSLNTLIHLCFFLNVILIVYQTLNRNGGSTTINSYHREN